MTGLSRRDCCAALAGLLLGSRSIAGAVDRFSSNFDRMHFVDQDGRPFLFERCAGHVLLVNFVFTGCSTVCPVQTRALVEVLEGLPPDVRHGVQFISISVDPLADTPAALKEYARRMGAQQKNWAFVAGSPSDMELVKDRLRLVRSTGGEKLPADHTTSLWLVDASGRLMQRLSGNPPDVRRVRNELVALRRS